MKKIQFVFLVLLEAANPAHAQSHIDAEPLLAELKILSSDDFQGRLAGSAAGLKTQQYLVDSFVEMGLPVCGDQYRQDFTIRSRSASNEGANILGLIPGSMVPEDVIVLSAHFDHLGVRNGEVYNGADDNASGTAALIEMARYFVNHPPQHSVLIAAFDAEEEGLQGSRAFVNDPCVDLDRILIDVNMDMISRSSSAELFASGTHYYPDLIPLLNEAADGSGIHLLMGHDEPGTGSDDWTSASDQGPFFQRHIPHIYFGVEDHPGYHNPGDDFDQITPRFYVSAANVILNVVKKIDRQMKLVRSLRDSE